MLHKYISIPVFLISLTLGLFCVYIMGAEKKVVYIYPSPSNHLKYQYRDNADQCFEYIPDEVKCPMNPLSIKTIPSQK